MIRQLDERVMVSGQVAPHEVAGLAEQGVAILINNRPDGEEPGQPSSAEIEAAARAAGLGYRHIPIAGGFPSDAVEAMAEALAQKHDPALLFCRSGTRSTVLWALARASRGVDAGTLIGQAAEAGYDLRPIAGRLSR